MKQETMPRFILRISLTLLLITSVMAAALAITNYVTKPRIEQHTQAKILEAVETVLPGGGAEIPFSDATGLVDKVYASDTGYAVQVQPNGFDGAITMMVGIDKTGKVLGISVISHTETAGLGAVAAADTSAGSQFRQQFVGAVGSVAVFKDGGQIDAITGATITSRGICDGVNAALTCVAGLS
ncbi:MAG: RnfABCDGE type electron transport complex subunit G [Ruminococcaceae bacterium]|nr:RnfABCDGE type electron transport complex subunit G [Oscillospiraceae bacterium]